MRRIVILVLIAARMFVLPAASSGALSQADEWHESLEDALEELGESDEFDELPSAR